MLQAVVQRDIPMFAGQPYKRGQVIPSGVLNSDKVSRAAVDALLATKQIAMVDEEAEVADPAILVARVKALEDTVKDQAEALEELSNKVASFVGVPAAKGKGK